MQNSKKIIFVSVIIVVTAIVLKAWLLGAIVRFGIRNQTSLRKRNELRDVYLKLPFPLDFKVYFFNVSNPEEIQNGAKPILTEIGPYWYDEFKEKVDVVDNDTEDSLSYTPYDLYRFNQNKSKNLKEDDYVTILHPVMVGMVNLVLRDSPVFLSIVNNSIPAIFNDPKSIFLTGKVKDILFNGVDLNCTSKEFSPTAICTQLKSQVPGLTPTQEDENVYLFSLLGSRNASLSKRIKVLRGIFHSKDLGRLMEVDGKKEIDIWASKQCNRFVGTDGWIFPPFLHPEEGIASFSTDLCRNIRLTYINNTVYKNIRVRLYEGNLGDQTNDINEKCYCRTEDTCLKRGVFDLSKCMGVPLFATLPHFLHSDESFLSQVEGLQPDDIKHGLRIYFEPNTGSPIFAAKRMQFNLDVQPTKKIALFSKLPAAMFPIFWIEESVDLQGALLKKLQSVFLMLLIADILLYLMILGGLGLLGFSLYMHFKNRKEVTITPISQAKNLKNNNEYDNNDMQHLTRRSGFNEKLGVVNHAMSGHEFDRY